jgi:hypothetical protein
MTARVRLEDLPPAVRVQVAVPLGQRPKRGRGSRGATRGGAWRCGRCGERFTIYTKAERHVDELHRAGRLDCELEEAP